MTNSKNAVWWAYMDRAVTRVMLEAQPGELNFSVHFLVKPEFKKDWIMEYKSEHRPEDAWPPLEKLKWATECGLVFYWTNWAVCVDT
jgi:hypothetical protein